MMYRHHSEADLCKKTRKRHISIMGRKCLLLVVAAVTVVFVSMRAIHSTESSRVERILSEDDAVVEESKAKDDIHRVYRRRIKRSAIPAINYNNIRYRELFNDSNYVQLAAARAGGIDPATVGDPAQNAAFVPIFSTALYSVDTMHHSVPYLLPETVLLIDYIAHRFKSLMEEHYPSLGEHSVIVTSALRTEQSERRLRRVNRNATDTSCHIYGTTFDLSAQRYLHVASGHDTVVDACKQMLALALYELRYEGLCYVKYERGSCFHITLRTTQYEGDAASETRSYVNPGSPDYLTIKKESKKLKSENEILKARHSRVKESTKQRAVKQERKKANEAPTNKRDFRTEPGGLTERERISLEQFER